MDNPFKITGLRHGTDDPRGLLERIDAQLAERIEEAVEMAALHLLVELRKRHNQPAPETDSRADREEFQALAADLLAHLGRAFEAGLAAEHRASFERARAEGAEPRSRELRGQIFLARQLPDYWQRFEIHRAAHAEAQLAAPPPSTGFFKRLFDP
jgi:sugar phosphate isomerase/epimerase